jgi:hypothetical protein
MLEEAIGCRRYAMNRYILAGSQRDGMDGSVSERKGGWWTDQRGQRESSNMLRYDVSLGKL